MPTLIGCLAVLLATASIIDWILADTAVARLRQSKSRVQRDLAAMRVSKTMLSANVLFCEVFDAVCGPKFWSWRRVRRSCFLSVTAYLFAFLFVGIDNSILGIDDDDSLFLIFGSRWGFFFGMIVMFMPVNLVADFLSLQETRWVMERARRGRQLWGIAAWAALDLVFTTLTYLASLGVLMVVLIVLDNNSSFMDVEYLSSFDILRSPLGLPFFLSTFGTSAVWLMFVLFVTVSQAGRRSSRIASLALDIVGDSAAPARTVAGIIAVPVIVAYSVLEAGRRFLF